MIDIVDRIRNKKLHDRIVTAEEAAAYIKPGMNIGTSGFTPSGYAKVVTTALAKRMEKEPFRINLFTGASTGPEQDDVLALAHGIERRAPYQTSRVMRKFINSGDIKYTDMHLSECAQYLRYGFMKRGLDVAIIEACAITEEGNIIPTTAVGNAASYVQQADVVIIELNVSQPEELEGMHDIYVPLDPPNRLPIPIIRPGDRIGTPYIPCDPQKIKYIVPSNVMDNTRSFTPIDDNARKMSAHIIDFLEVEKAAGRMPKNLLPIQSGVGSVANAVVHGFVESDLKDLSVYTEVIQDGMFDLIDAGKLTVVSGTGFTPSPEGLKRFYKNIKEYRKHIVLRPQEISNSPEVIRRLGVIAMNTAIECDIYGNVNSTHIMGTKMMNGIGGSGDFARNAYLTIFCTASTAKDGQISCVVPFCSHVDHTEHDVDIIVTEQGLADLRGLSPKERAKEIIEKCSHPDYRAELREYFERADRETAHAQTPHLLEEAFSWHTRYVKTGTMLK